MATSGASQRRATIANARLVSQRLVASDYQDAAAVVRFMTAMQAQDFAGAKWSIGLRAPGITVRDVDAAIAAGTVVRSWPMRGTLHFVAAEDLNWMLELLGPRVLTTTAKRREALGLDARTLRRARSVAEKALQGNKRLTREALLAAFAAGGVTTEHQRGYHLLFNLSLTKTLAFGPPAAKEQTFVLLDEWITAPRRLDRDAALGELAQRYFAAHGPATARDFTGWSKLVAADVKRAIAIARPKLAERAYDGNVFLQARDLDDRVASTRREASASVRLLPGFDEYVLGYQDRSAILASDHKERIVPGANGVFFPTIVVDGQIVGTWRRVRKGTSFVLEASRFVRTRISATERDRLERARIDYERFLGT